jgi:hypothetical protein
MTAQQSRASDQAELETKNNMSYYQRRGLEDAQHEQELEVKSKEEHTFWEEQKKYEKELKKKNEEHIERIFKVKEGYAAHHNYCDSHCHHSSTGISMQDIITMNIENHVMKIELLGLQ